MQKLSRTPLIDVMLYKLFMEKKIILVSIYFLLGLVAPITAQSESIEVTDQMGRKIIVKKNPQRIIALAPSITEIVFALGQENRLAGATIYSDFPQEAKKLPRVGSYVQLDLERIAALNPDICIAVKDGNPIAAIRKLELMKIPVYAVNPKDLDSVIKTVQDLGSLLGAAKRADWLAQNMKSRIERVKFLANKSDHRPRVFFQIGISPIVSVGTNTFINQLITLAGGINVAAGKATYPRFSREQVIAIAPDLIIITSMARAALFDEVKAEWEKWPDMPAVKNNRILLEDSNLFDRPTPRLVDGLELLLKLIHPELFQKDSN